MRRALAASGSTTHNALSLTCNFWFLGRLWLLPPLPGADNSKGEGLPEPITTRLPRAGLEGAEPAHTTAKPPPSIGLTGLGGSAAESGARLDASPELVARRGGPSGLSPLLFRPCFFLWSFPRLRLLRREPIREELSKAGRGGWEP